MGGAELHPDRPAAGGRNHQGAWRLLGRIRRLGRHRPRPYVVPRYRRGRLGEHGGPLGRQLWHPGRGDLLLPGDYQERRVPDRPGARDRRVQPQAHGRHVEGAERGAGRREEPLLGAGSGHPGGRAGVNSRAMGALITVVFVAAVLFLAYRRLSLLAFTATFTALLIAYTVLGASGTPAGAWKGFLWLLL